VLRTAKNANAIVSSLFPQEVQDRLMNDAEQQEVHNNAKERAKNNALSSTSKKISDFLDSNEENYDGVADGNPYVTPAIANLYPAVSVMISDLKGFTSWSSGREPSQVGFLSLAHSRFHDTRIHSLIVSISFLFYGLGILFVGNGKCFLNAASVLGSPMEHLKSHLFVQNRYITPLTPSPSVNEFSRSRQLVM